MIKKNKIFFNGLNELRAIAALAVIFHHIELYKFTSGISSLYDLNDLFRFFIQKLGRNGVLLFFVLSGFLITYLLIVEKKKTKEISIKKFYLRRVLRIWPLYFLILIIGFFLVPNLYFYFKDFFSNQNNVNSRIESLEYGNNLILYLVFLSNIAMKYYGPVIGSSQSWSVSVEEQFYLIWPWVVRIFYKRLIAVLTIIVLSSICIRLFFPQTVFKIIFSVFYIDYMAMGGIFAYTYFHKKEILGFIVKNKWFIFLILSSVMAHLIFGISDFTKSLTYGFLIVSLIEINFKLKVLSYIGKLSYGVYMYHPLIMYISFALIDKLGVENFYLFNISIYTTIIGLTILISYLSYYYFEMYFLKLKSKISPVLSGNS